MIDVHYMEERYKLDTLVANYCLEIKKLNAKAETPAEQTKVQQYYQAAQVFSHVGIKDIVQFALAWGRGSDGRASQMREALSVILGNRVGQPTKIDLEYANLLLVYSIAFKEYRGNLKEWLLRFVLASRFSPLHGLFDREIEAVITDTRNKIVAYEALL